MVPLHQLESSSSSSTTTTTRFPTPIHQLSTPSTTTSIPTKSSSSCSSTGALPPGALPPGAFPSAMGPDSHHTPADNSQLAYTRPSPSQQHHPASVPRSNHHQQQPINPNVLFPPGSNSRTPIQVNNYPTQPLLNTSEEHATTNKAPAKWQLSQEGLGYLVILSSSSSSEEEEDNNREEVVDARLAIKTETIRIGSSESDCTVCLNNPSINPIHLIININKITYQATLQVIEIVSISISSSSGGTAMDHESIDWDKFKNNSQESSSSILTTIEPASPSKLIIDPNVSFVEKKEKYVYVDVKMKKNNLHRNLSYLHPRLLTTNNNTQSQQQQQQPRRKSLLQKLLIKQAVLAHHSDPTIVQSGFSSSEDDEDQEEDRDSSDDDLSTRMTIPTDCSSAKRDAIFKTTTKAKTTDDIIETASPLVSNSRRSISPNAKLFSKYSKNERSLIGDDTSSLINQLSNFSPPPSSSSSSSSSSSKVADSSTVRNNTHFNSKSPSFPINDHDNHPSPNQGVLRNRLRSSLKATTTTTTCTSPTNQSPYPLPRPRLLLPIFLTVSFVHREQELGLSNHRQDYDFGSIGDSKRKVRFDGDVFCLEFDQLPEELNSNLKRREIKRVKVNDEEVTDSTKIIKRRTTLPLSTTSNSTVRARRHSPRLSTPPLSSAPQQQQQQFRQMSPMVLIGQRSE
ncbi:hypothetical protein H4Q26_013530 [Puccinia striiformis f. sp. tritici PST-130]|nr:hypothetical protein H4Q26_013530 [Puccinia striiformis f. sp. tritici PST-130]